MNVCFNRKKFSEWFDLAASATGQGKDAGPSAKVLMLIQGTQWFLQATNSETSVVVDCADAVVATQTTTGKVLLDPRRISAILKESSGDEVTIKATGNSIVVSTAEGNYTLPESDPAEFPKVDAIDSQAVEIASTALLEALTLVSFAVDDKSTRYQLGGVLFEGSGDQVDLVATDGRRLSTVSIDVSEFDGSLSGIVSARPLSLLMRILSNDAGFCGVRVGLHAASFQAGNVTLATRLVEGRYPKWRSVIPSQDNCNEIGLNASAFGQAVKQAAIVADQESRGIVFDFKDGNCGISARTAEVGESAVNVPVVYTGSLKTTMDFRFVQEWFSRLPKGETVKMFVRDAKSPALFVWKMARYVIMPMGRD